MHRTWKWGALALGVLVLGIAAWPLAIYLRSEAAIRRHYPLATPQIHEQVAKDSAARGAHLVRILGCTDCHGANLKGGQFDGARFYAPSLRRDPATLTDRDFARAVRFGLKGDGTSLWGMPSESYLYMRDADVDAIIAYVRTLPPDHAAPPAQSFDLSVRRAILNGRIVPAGEAVQSTLSPIDLGPRYDGGRYLARTACSQCHGLDLAGSPDGSEPDLSRVEFYSPSDFFQLLHRGKLRDGRIAKDKSHQAGWRFSHFADYEAFALYNYLYVRSYAVKVTRTPN